LFLGSLQHRERSNRTTIERTDNEYKQLGKHMEIEITESDWTEKKPFTCTDAAVVEA